MQPGAELLRSAVGLQTEVGNANGPASLRSRGRGCVGRASASVGPVVAAVATDDGAAREGVSCQAAVGLRFRKDGAAVVGPVAGLASGGAASLGDVLVPAHPRGADPANLLLHGNCRLLRSVAGFANRQHNWLGPGTDALGNTGVDLEHAPDLVWGQSPVQNLSWLATDGEPHYRPRGV